MWLLNLVFYLVFAIASVAGIRWIGSSAITEIFIPNLATIVIALLAINVQTVAVIAVKLREISDRTSYKFETTLGQMRLAICEQIGLVILALVITAFSKSAMTESKLLMIELGTFFVLYAALHIFLDVSLSLIRALFPSDSN